MTRRLTSYRAVLGVCAALLGTQMHAARAADSWEPHRPIEIVVPSAAGGGLDLVARTLQNAIVQEKVSSRPVTVLNRPGGAGTVGLAYINAHRGDGHYVSVQALPIVTNRLTGLSSVGIDDVTPLGMFVTEQVVFSVPASSPIKSGKDLIQMLRQNPRNVIIGVSSSPGGQSHDAAALVLKAAGQDPTKLKIVFFDSGGEAMTSLMGGHVTVTATPAGTAIGPSQSGRVRMIAIAGPEREHGALADVPTWKEQGLDVDFTTWRVLVGPKGMPANEIAWWDNVLQKATSSPEWATAIERNEWTAAYRNSAQTKQFLEDENKRLGSLVSELGLAKN